MECDDLIDQLLSEDPPAETAVALPQTKCDAAQNDPEKKRARLAAIVIVAGGTAKKYLGKQPTLAQIDEMTDVEIQKYYTRLPVRGTLGRLYDKNAWEFRAADVRPSSG